jgi:hypothetical protein
MAVKSQPQPEKIKNRKFPPPFCIGLQIKRDPIFRTDMESPFILDRYENFIYG